MPRKLNPRPPLRLPTVLPAGRPRPYELEFESIQARDQNALTRRAAAGWRVSWLMISSRNVPDGQGGNPMQTFWDILWERPIALTFPSEEETEPEDSQADEEPLTPS